MHVYVNNPHNVDQIWDLGGRGNQSEPLLNASISPEALLGGWVFSGFYKRPNPVAPHVLIYISPRFPEHALLLDMSGYYKVVSLQPTRPDQNRTLAAGKVDFLFIPE
jgi:hypothetical protein